MRGFSSFACACAVSVTISASAQASQAIRRIFFIPPAGLLLWRVCQAERGSQVSFPLFSLDARELDHLRPLFGGIRDDRRKLRRRAPKHCAAKLDDRGFDLAIGEAGIVVLVQHIAEFGWGGPQPAPA